MFTAEMLKTEEENKGESKPMSEDVIGFKKSPVMTILMHTFESIERYSSRLAEFD